MVWPLDGFEIHITASSGRERKGPFVENAARRDRSQRFLKGYGTTGEEFLLRGALLQRGLLVVFGPARFRERVETAKPFHQKREMAAILVAHGRELQSQSAAGFLVPDDGFNPDLPFLDKKIKAGLRPHGF